MQPCIGPDLPHDSDTLRRLAGERLLPHAAPPSAEADGASDYDLNPGSGHVPPEPLIPAAVLVTVRAASPMTFILTERTAHLARHAGQIAFPGGKIDEVDASPLAAALREAREEIGLLPGHVEPLGYLEPYRTATGYHITTVVGLVAPEFEPVLHADEVASVFEVPFSFLMNPSNHRIDSRVWQGAARQFYAMPYEQRYIWGATAGIIRMFYRRLFSP